MDGPTQTAALVAACRQNLLDPRLFLCVLHTSYLL
jgi:hypothetical protein